MKILAFDISSTNIGYALLDGDHVLRWGTEVLRGEIAERCCEARAAFLRLLQLKDGAEYVAYEGPVAKYAQSLIAQQRVVGQLLGVLWPMGLRSMEIAPAAAKQALTGTGRADKALMVRCAQSFLPLPDMDDAESKDTYIATYEHVADAVGVGLAAQGLIKRAALAAGEKRARVRREG